ncbi:MAG: hypothetical protein WCD37_06550, partial [Chloroflexia bacterium]
LLQYMHGGYISQVESLVASRNFQMELLLQGNSKDPMAAILYVYALLKLGHLAQLDTWTNVLLQECRWSPDSFAVRGEWLARLGKHEEALRCFLHLPSLGIPALSDGLSIAIDRLRLYASAGEKQFGEAKIKRARAELHKMQSFAATVDFHKPIVTFTGRNPSHPDGKPLS